MSRLSSWLQHSWYADKPMRVLVPFSRLFLYLAKKRKQKYFSGAKEVWRAPVPVVVVGNINVGGVGKTPFVIWLVQHLQSLGYKPGVVSRGYGGQSNHYPVLLNSESDPKQVGDEPKMLFDRLSCPVAVDPVRVRAVQNLLLANQGVDIIVADDGLQHYALGRDVEIVVIDGARGLGNGYCLPAGPLREPAERLSTVDFVIANGENPQGLTRYTMRLVPKYIEHLHSKEQRPLAWLKNRRVRAIAGIGNPQRFFSSLNNLGAQLEPHSFSDHHKFSIKDFAFVEKKTLIMTEKDATKCRELDLQDAWFLSVELELNSLFVEKLTQTINHIVSHRTRS